MRKGGNGHEDGPFGLGQFPNFRTVGKTPLPPTETRAKTLKENRGLLLFFSSYKGRWVREFALLMGSPAGFDFFLTHCD